MDADTRAALDEGARLIAQYGRHELPVPTHSLPETWDQVLSVETQREKPWRVHTMREGWPEPVVFDAALHETLIQCALTGVLVRLSLACAFGTHTHYITAVEVRA